MSKKRLGIIIVIVVAVGLAGVAFALTRPDETPTVTTPSSDTLSTSGSDTSQNQEPSDEQPTTQTYTSTEVAQHATEDDCWTIINGNVYDLTSFIADHPGGDEILRACGQDGSTLFNSRETAEGESVGSGTPHSSSAQSLLAELQIGTLAQ